MSWFNEVTGTNAYERQSWRDNYNGGRAAGDITGNVNRNLDAQRSAFQGATLSGSSTHYSALELAQRSGGVGHPAASVGAGAPKSSGPGNEVVIQGPVTPGRPAGGSGAGSRLTVSAPLSPKLSSSATDLLIGGDWYEPNTMFSDVGEAEERWGDSEFMSPTWFYSWAVAGADAYGRYKAAENAVFDGIFGALDAAIAAYPSWSVSTGDDGINPLQYAPIAEW